MTDALMPEQRRTLIQEWLQTERSLTIEQLVQRFGVSGMTIHRDLDRLAAEGAARKVRGGIVAIDESPAALADPHCVTCDKRVSRRMAWVATTGQGERWQACCAHCGLLYLRHSDSKQLVLGADFLYGQMVNVFQASYVLGSAVTLCCVPSVLCFATRHDAERYQRGFGGEVLCFDEVVAVLSESHQAPDDLPSDGEPSHAL